MQVAVIVNAGAGSIGAGRSEERLGEIREALAAAGIDGAISVCEPAQLAETARRLARSAVDAGAIDGIDAIDAIVAAGGDGTVSAIASGLVGSEVPLAVLPLGTRNHFARDLGIPIADLDAAARAIRHGETRSIDVGEVNGRLFINNSSIGLYPEVVRVRDLERRSTGRSKGVAMVLATTRVLRRFPLLAVSVSTPARTVVTRTPFVFVGNNAYETGALALGRRPALDAGRLSLYTVRCRGRLHLLYLIVRALVGRVQTARAFEIEQVTEASVLLRRRKLTVAVDGELVRMESPLRYRIRPRALRVIAAPAEERADTRPRFADAGAPPTAIGAAR